MEKLTLFGIIGLASLDTVVFFFVLNWYRKEIINLRRQVFQWKASMERQARERQFWEARNTSVEVMLNDAKKDADEWKARAGQYQHENTLLKKALQDAKL